MQSTEAASFDQLAKERRGFEDKHIIPAISQHPEAKVQSDDGLFSSAMYNNKTIDSVSCLLYTSPSPRDS